MPVNFRRPNRSADVPALTGASAQWLRIYAGRRICILTQRPRAGSRRAGVRERWQPPQVQGPLQVRHLPSVALNRNTVWGHLPSMPQSPGGCAPAMFRRGQEPR
jgi:hypothetical protein